MKMILILPTGEWAEINQNNQAAVVGLSEEQLSKINMLSPSTSAMQALMVDNVDIDAWFKELEA